MGKSETARLFAAEGVAVHDADAAIAPALWQRRRGGRSIAQAFPGAVKDGAVDRAALSALVVNDPAALARLEALVHPLVAARQERFSADTPQPPIILFDIPLLFETGADARWMRWWWRARRQRCSARACWRGPA